MLHPFFNQTEPRKMRPTCNDIQVTVLPLPSEDGPRTLIIPWEIRTHADGEPKDVALNDPVSVEMIISGTGNFDAVTAHDHRSEFVEGVSRLAISRAEQ